MQTSFTLAQLADPDIRAANDILRTCVHCGFCTATCPTYVLLGDEADSPRGRIVLIKDMLEGDKPAGAAVTRHVDRCLSCLSCMTTCPSGVNYMHLVDHARARIEETHRRSIFDRALRGLLATVLPRPRLFRLALAAARPIRPVARILPRRVRAMLTLAPAAAVWPTPLARVFPAKGARRARVALLPGCVQRVMAPTINEATVRLLNRHGVEVIVPPGTGCCGALAHHLGRTATSRRQVKANLDVWWRELTRVGLDAVIVNTSGCGTMIKDYRFLLRNDEAYGDKAARLSALTRDVSEFLAELGPTETVRGPGLTVAYQSACSLQHGQGIDREPQALLRKLGYTVTEPVEAHLCCGSAGTYNVLQPELAGRLRERKAAHLDAIGAQVIASGNIGCITQLYGATMTPVVHTVQLLDWATGGPRPSSLAFLAAGVS